MLDRQVVARLHPASPVGKVSRYSHGCQLLWGCSVLGNVASADKATARQLGLLPSGLPVGGAGGAARTARGETALVEARFIVSRCYH
jgi:hypothetical protein